MKNYVLLLASSLVLALFWYTIYAFADQTVAAYLAMIFGITSVGVLCWIIITLVMVIKIESKQELEKMKQSELAQKKVLA